MRIQIIREAIAEAERFHNAALKVLAKNKTEKWVDGYIYTCKEAAACKRASMDLTRILSRLRRKSDANHL